MSRTVEYYFSLSSPWSYLGHAELIAILRRHAVALRYRPVTLPELFPQSGGLPLVKRHPLRQNYRMLELQRWREHRGVAMHLHPKFWPFNPTLVDRVVTVLAADPEQVEKFLPSAFAGIFENERDLGDEDTIASLLNAAGLPAAAILEQAKSEATAVAYAANLDEALARGVFGAPSYVLDGEVFWGQDRLGFLDAALTSGRAAFCPNV